jgi:hypothetical protein
MKRRTHNKPTRNVHFSIWRYAELNYWSGVHFMHHIDRGVRTPNRGARADITTAERPRLRLAWPMLGGSQGI